MADKSKPTNPTVEPYTALVRALHGDNIDAGHEAGIAKQVAALRKAIEQINAVPLTNADEPAPRFAAFRDDS